MSMPVVECGYPVNLTATGNISAGTCRLIGFYVNNTNAGTLVLTKGGASGTALSGTITPAIGFHRFPVAAGGILHATIGGTALNVTFFIIPEGPLT